jgi:hypothetical protein
VPQSRASKNSTIAHSNFTTIKLFRPSHFCGIMLERY